MPHWDQSHWPQHHRHLWKILATIGADRYDSRAQQKRKWTHRDAATAAPRACPLVVPLCRSRHLSFLVIGSTCRGTGRGTQGREAISAWDFPHQTPVPPPPFSAKIQSLLPKTCLEKFLPKIVSAKNWRLFSWKLCSLLLRNAFQILLLSTWALGNSGQGNGAGKNRTKKQLHRFTLAALAKRPGTATLTRPAHRQLHRTQLLCVGRGPSMTRFRPAASRAAVHRTVSGGSCLAALRQPVQKVMPNGCGGSRMSINAAAEPRRRGSEGEMLNKRLKTAKRKTKPFTPPPTLSPESCTTTPYPFSFIASDPQAARHHLGGPRQKGATYTSQKAVERCTKHAISA